MKYAKSTNRLFQLFGVGALPEYNSYVYSPAYTGYLFSLGRLRLSRPGCLVPR